MTFSSNGYRRADYQTLSWLFMLVQPHIAEPGRKSNCASTYQIPMRTVEVHYISRSTKNDDANSLRHDTKLKGHLTVWTERLIWSICLSTVGESYVQQGMNRSKYEKNISKWECQMKLNVVTRNRLSIIIASMISWLCEFIQFKLDGEKTSSLQV